MKKNNTGTRNKERQFSEEEPVRLNKYLAQCGLGSRRACDELIASGRIYLNGKRVKELGVRINPLKDKVSYKGKELTAVHTLEYWILHKPKGPLVTHHDPEGRETVFDYLKKQGKDLDRLNYVGRLDRNSEGLLLLTNDGSLIHGLTHPRYHIKKVYRIRINRKLSPEHAYQMVNEGVLSKNQELHAGEIKTAESPSKGQHWYEVVLYEGKNRQIRRMFEELGYTIVRLKRIQFGSLRLRTLPRGAFRQLTSREVAAMKSVGYRV
ncbi:MAG: pseudouridine synthase [Chitinivibrionales bacterium]|nr:pseudouridine synthase [Chitinivibrionales bacterium]